MRLLRALLATVLSACAVVLVAPAPPAAACSCAAGTPASYAEGADVIFVGTLSAPPADPAAGPQVSSSDPVSYPFAVERVLKGQLATSLDVDSARSGASCGLEGMEVGTRYAMFAEVGRDDETLVAGLCGGSQRATPALVRRLAKLTGPGDVPVTTATTPGAATDRPERASGGSPTTAYVVGLGVVVLAAGAWALLVRRRRVGGPA